MAVSEKDVEWLKLYSKYSEQTACYAVSLYLGAQTGLLCCKVQNGDVEELLRL